ncbi:MAG TPA: PspA/IM30 family protein, partial [Kribbellaceae bacterium]
EAQTRINEAFSGISEEMSDVGLAVQRAEDKTAQMQARAGAIDELLASGALDDVTAVGTGTDSISLELDRMASTSDVELELQQMKAHLAPASSEPPKQIAQDTTESSPRPAAQPQDQVQQQAQPQPQDGDVR